MIFLLLACSPVAPQWYYGEDLTDLVVTPIDWDEGVYPSTSILDDPSNPFADGIGDTKWDILATNCTPGFYAFGTALAYQPTGENQYYTSFCLQSVYDGARLAPEDTYWAWSAAVRGYQTVLDSFPDSVTYDSTGTIAYPLAPLAYNGIVSLGATPEGWVEVLEPDGSTTVIPEGSAP